MTLLLALAAVGAAALAVSGDGWPRWFLLAASGLCAVVVVNRARARVVVTPETLEIRQELGTRRVPRADVQQLECVRDGLGWSGLLVLRNDRRVRLLPLAAFQQENAALAVEELREALALIPAPDAIT